MPKLADLSDEQLERRMRKQNRRETRQQLQAFIITVLTSNTIWGKISRPSQIRAAAKLLAARIVAAQRRNELAAPIAELATPVA